MKLLFNTEKENEVVERAQCRCDPNTLSYSEHYYNVCRSCLGYIRAHQTRLDPPQKKLEKI